MLAALHGSAHEAEQALGSVFGSLGQAQVWQTTHTVSCMLVSSMHLVFVVCRARMINRYEQSSHDFLVRHELSCMRRAGAPG